MNDLDQQLRDYYQSHSLPDDRVARILESGKIVRPPFWKQPALWAIAASLTLLIGISFLWLRPEPSMESTVAADVWKNHRKQLAPEVATASFAEIQAALPRLDFRIAPTRPEMLAGLQILGGRYCSILDELAAQISLVDADGRPCTLYIAPLTPPLTSITPGIVRTESGTVQIWTDAHRVFAMAR